MEKEDIKGDFHKRLSFLVGTEEPFKWANRVGIPKATFHRIWTNHDIPKYDHLCRIARLCNVSLDWLLLGKQEIDFQTDFHAIPFVGFASCGLSQGWYNEEELSQTILIPSFLEEAGVFSVLSRGDSMKPYGILDGNVCLVYPNRKPDVGKPVFLRTTMYKQGKECSLTTIKLFESENETSVTLSGWLPTDETGHQSKFSEQRKKSVVAMIAPVGSILPVSLEQKKEESKQVLDEEALKMCLESLQPLYQELESNQFAEAILHLYKKFLEKRHFDLEDIKFISSIKSQKP